MGFLCTKNVLVRWQDKKDKQDKGKTGGCQAGALKTQLNKTDETSEITEKLGMNL